MTIFSTLKDFLYFIVALELLYATSLYVRGDMQYGCLMFLWLQCGKKSQ